MTGTRIITRHPAGSGEWVCWRDPVATFSTHQTGDVTATLRAIEKQVARGHHALGFLAYEAGAAFDPHFMIQTGATPTLPLLWFALFEECTPFTPPAPTPPPPLVLRPDLSRADYRHALALIKRHIAAGDTYQVNYTFLLRAGAQPALPELFSHLVDRQPSPFAMLIETPAFSIASTSPERFFSLDGERIRVEPMKGTCPRGPLPELDRQAGAALRASVKNRAENVMIVDMMRNDLGRIADPGSVNVASLFDVTPWPTLWQMTSTVTATTTASIPDLFHALFPCASITGAPKLKTSEIIAALEPGPRGLYTGAIGRWSPNRQAEFAVAIRTLVSDHSARTLTYGVGSGVVWDSDPDEEFRECLLKARVLHDTTPPFRLLETMRWDPVAGYILRDRHLDRMAISAEHFQRPFARPRIQEKLDALARTFTDHPQRIRLLLDHRGRITLQHQPADQPAVYDHREQAPILTARIDTRRTNPDSLFLYHKTTRRALYQQARRRCPDADETLLVNSRSELMEFCNGNLALERDGRLLTPDLAAGLLPGVFRAELIDRKVLVPARLTLEDLTHANTLYWLNSVRGWRRVTLLS
ncbi:MAG TPA: chorismate-binding protein [Kiritimatiellia bacterium]|nr:chorismate-binding protein [Kiritimatiellia bacterium]